MAPPPVVTQAASYSTISLHYLESSPILVKGTVTGRHYEFSRANPDRLVDTRDAEALLRTQFFRKNR